MRIITRILKRAAAILISCVVAVSFSNANETDISNNYANTINYVAVSVEVVSINSPPMSEMALVNNIISTSADMKNIAIDYKVLNTKKGAHLFSEKNKSAPSLFAGNSIRILSSDNRA